MLKLTNTRDTKLYIEKMKQFFVCNSLMLSEINFRNKYLHILS